MALITLKMNHYFLTNTFFPTASFLKLYAFFSKLENTSHLLISIPFTFVKSGYPWILLAHMVWSTLNNIKPSDHSENVISTIWFYVTNSLRKQERRCLFYKCFHGFYHAIALFYHVIAFKLQNSNSTLTIH